MDLNFILINPNEKSKILLFLPASLQPMATVAYRGQGPAGWPNMAAFGMANALAHGQSTCSARPERGHCVGCSQRTWRGAVLTGALAAQRR
jgi:hypothetical protein